MALGGGAQRPVLLVKEPKKTGVRIARARTRGKNPLVTFQEVDGFSFSFFHKFNLEREAK